MKQFIKKILLITMLLISFYYIIIHSIRIEAVETTEDKTDVTISVLGFSNVYTFIK